MGQISKPGRRQVKIDTTAAEQRRLGGESLKSIAASLQVSVVTLRARLKRMGRAGRRSPLPPAERSRRYRLAHGQIRGRKPGRPWSS